MDVLYKQNGLKCLLCLPFNPHGGGGETPINTSIELVYLFIFVSGGGL